MAVFYWLLLILVAVGILAVFMAARKRKPRGEKPRPTYGGPIRFSDSSGRDMKIVRKDDGSFEILEEFKDK